LDRSRLICELLRSSQPLSLETGRITPDLPGSLPEEAMSSDEEQVGLSIQGSNHFMHSALFGTRGRPSQIFLVQVTLISSDNETFKVPKSVAIMSLTIKNTVDGRFRPFSGQDCNLGQAIAWRTWKSRATW